MNNKKKLTITGVIALILALLWPGSPLQLVNLGGSPGNLPADTATTSTVAVGPASIVVLFPGTPIARGCTSRAITTFGQPIFIQFDNTATSALTNSQGHWQAASTTVSYPAEDYGCNDWIVKDAGGTASTSLVITEYR